MKNHKLIGITLSLAVAGVLATACSRQATSSNAAQGNQQAEPTPGKPPAPSAMKAQIDSAALAINGAVGLVQQRQWQDTVTNLQAARTSIQDALSGVPGSNKATLLRQTLEDMKNNLDRAIKSAEDRDENTAARVRELQTGVNALKIQFPN